MNTQSKQSLIKSFEKGQGEDKTFKNQLQTGTHPINHPKKGKICCVDEILGEYLRFDEHDCNDPNNPDYGWKWWNHTHFKPFKDKDLPF